MFSSRPRSIPCLDIPSVEQQFFYAMTNPVKDGLVDRITHWKGFSSYAQLARGEDITCFYLDYEAWRAQPIRTARKPLRHHLPEPKFSRDIEKSLQPRRREKRLSERPQMWPLFSGTYGVRSESVGTPEKNIHWMRFSF